MKLGYKLSSEEFGPVQLVEQAAATCALLMPGRFFLGLGTGENLNEHVVGRGWPSGDVPHLRDERRPTRAAARSRRLAARA